MRKTFAVIDQTTGDIVKVVNINEGQPLTDEEWVDITGQPDEYEINVAPRKFKITDNVPRIKPVISLSIDKTVIRPDGTDVATVTLSGALTEKNIEMVVRDQKVTVDSTETLEITSDTADSINIAVTDHRFYSEPIRVLVKP